MLPVGRQLKGLTHLCITVGDPLDPGERLDENHLDPDEPLEDVWCLGAADINSIAACCPRLKRLEVHGTMHGNAEGLYSLLELQQQLVLSSLSVGGPTFANDAGPILVHMTSLVGLSIMHAPDFTLKGRQHLAALRQLTHLHVVHCAIVRGLPAELRR